MPKPSTKTRKAHEDNGHAAPDSLLANSAAAGKKRSSPKTNSRVCKVGHISPAQKMAESPDLVDQIGRDIRAMGLVGEENSAMLIYIAGTSRLLAEPLAVVTRGPTGSGKTVQQQRTLALMPPDDLISATSLTTAAIFNEKKKDFLTHKILETGERKHGTDDKTRDENANIRQLLSEKKISRYVALQNKSGGWTTTKQTREGPIAFFETTTCDRFFAEDLNRVLQVFTDDSAKQTRAILKQIGETYLRKPEKVGGQESKDEIIDRHREFQQSLEPRAIKIPYALELAKNLPAEQIKARRVITQILATIEAVTLLHGFQRDVDQDGHLVATRKDYEIARRLLLKPIERSIPMASTIKLYKRLREKLTKNEFDSTETDEIEGFENRMNRKRFLDQLQAAGLIKLVRKSISKKPARWRWTGTTPASPLPAVALVFPKTDA